MRQEQTLKILIMGGYGVFGGRLAELLSDVSDLELIIAGRSHMKASAFCKSYKGAATVTPLQLDRSNIEEGIQTAQPDVVVDASGPFQNYGSNPYSVITACIKQKTNYLDFADSADFVFGVSQFDAAAKEANIYILSGVSSFPVLTAAVLREIAKDMDIVTVEGGIAPSPYAGIGLNVMRAVVGYAGSRVKLTRGGKPGTAIGLAEHRRFTIAPPGEIPLRNIHFSLVDVPDLQVIPPEHETLRDIWMGAGPVPETLHRILNLLAKARAVFGLPSFVPLAPLFYRVLNLMKFGEHRGGMFVHVRGTKNDIETERTWHLLAEGDDGPYIPSMAIECLVRKRLKGNIPDPGARPATRALDLADYQTLFAKRTISTGFRAGDEKTKPLYQQILGTAFTVLPTPVQALHATREPRRWAGTACVQRGKNIFARTIARAIGFPNSGTSTPITVELVPSEKGERWTRNFGGKTFSSLQQIGAGKNNHLLLERFGPIEVALALTVKDNRLFLIPRRWTLFGLPMPKFLLPAGNSHEREQNGHFYFDVEIAVPLIGLIVSYEGELRPA